MQGQLIQLKNKCRASIYNYLDAGSLLTIKEPRKLQEKRNDMSFLCGTLVADFDLLKIRHLAAENGSKSSASTVGICSSSTLLDEINLEPDFFLFWIRLLVEKTPRGVWMIKTVSGFGALHQKQRNEQKILDRLWKTRGRVESAHEPHHTQHVRLSMLAFISKDSIPVISTIWNHLCYRPAIFHQAVQLQLECK